MEKCYLLDYDERFHTVNYYKIPKGRLKGKIGHYYFIKGISFVIFVNICLKVFSLLKGLTVILVKIPEHFLKKYIAKVAKTSQLMICGMYFPLYYKNIYHKYSEVHRSFEICNAQIWGLKTCPLVHWKILSNKEVNAQCAKKIW